MAKRFWIALCLVVPSVTGCAPSGYLVKKPMILSPQGVVAQRGTDVRARSMQALLNSFSESPWAISKVDRKKGIIIAEGCELVCAEVQATVKKNGSVEILRTPGQSLSANGKAKLRSWLERLKKSYEANLKAKKS